MVNLEKEMDTTRLLIRNFQKKDATGCFRNWGQDNSLGKYIILYPMKNLQEMENFINLLALNKDAWVVIEKNTREPIGYITVDIPYQQLKIGEIAYAFGEEFQGRGYAQEAVACVLKEYFLNRDLYMIEAKYNETNVASAKLLQKMGFRIDGRLRDRRIDIASGKRNDLIVCSMIKEEFLQWKNSL